MGFLRFQREYELEADQLGVELVARAGYDARWYRTYVDRAQNAPVVPASGSDEFLQARAAVIEAIKAPVRRPPTLRR
ncbi:MAG: M48 family metalloprotease [Acidobacteria bacterium]|nr:M48 family metalloprotease [Acidobacteriota bacterium]